MLIKKSRPSGLTFVAELDKGIDGPVSPKMDHLVCFLAGNLALGATNGLPLSVAQRMSWNAQQATDMKLAKELMKTCNEMYRATKTGIAPEIVYFNENEGTASDMIIKPLDAHNLQRPETVESLFLMWRITKDPTYRYAFLISYLILNAYCKFIASGDGRCLRHFKNTPD